MGERRVPAPARVLTAVAGLLLAASMIAVLGAVTSAVPARAATTTGEVYVIQAIADSTADILVDDNVVKPAAAPKTVVGPLRLTSGNHVLTLRKDGQSLVTAQFSVTAGAITDVVAHRTADAAMLPQITVFPVDTSGVRAGTSRLVVSHVAVAPPADIRVDGEPLFRNVASGESLTLDLAPKAYKLDVVPTSTNGPIVLGPVDVTLKAGTVTRVFAMGDASSGTTAAVVQVLPAATVGTQRPTKVQTGSGGQAADSYSVGGMSTGTLLLVSAAAGIYLFRRLRRGEATPPSVGSRHAR